MLLRTNTHRRGGFTLVELLTVIGIISLLIGILLPSLSRARAQAKRVQVQAQLDAIGKGLEMFRNDFNQYPESARRRDPIDWGAAADDRYLSGAHWLARALAGHDFLGVDTGGLVLKGAPSGGGLPLTLADLNPDASPPGQFSDRKGTYLEAEVFARDTDSEHLFQTPDAPATERAVVIDAYKFPILYYRANGRARLPFGETVADGGAYIQEDNAEFTGGRSVTPSNATFNGWDFAGSGFEHGISEFGDPNNVYGPMPATHKGKSFIRYLHSESTMGTGGVLKPLNPETFVLISAGADGVYGTDDDVSNIRIR